MGPSTLLSRAEGSLRAALLKIAWLPPLLIRASLAAVFVPTGWGKLHNLQKVTGFFASLGIPHPHFNAVLVASTELICGSLILVGLLTRLAALPLIVSMTVAIVTAKREDIEGVADLFALSEFVYIVLLVALVVGGAGALSLDGPIARLRARVRTGTP